MSGRRAIGCGAWLLAAALGAALLWCLLPEPGAQAGPVPLLACAALLLLAGRSVALRTQRAALPDLQCRIKRNGIGGRTADVFCGESYTVEIQRQRGFDSPILKGYRAIGQLDAAEFGCDG